ncbi:Uncharacterized protein FWK35_00034298 [Aphis craccivora]|uniref:Uncharacterized protein n=1 Tax=Aphis craccivora TaxID=307492 RepID=A0A6G0W335_APHCR|nr:Uncharacterized protein FWK35_00034298 [Aphis craccivora]
MHLNQMITIHHYKQLYGYNIEEQNLLLNKMCIGKLASRFSKKAILMHINGTKALLKVEVTFNQQNKPRCIKKFIFLTLFKRGTRKDLNALFKIRLIILGKNIGIVSNQSNTVDKNDEEFLVAKTLQQLDVKINNVKENSEDAESLTDTTSGNVSSKDGNKIQHDLELDPTEYIAD